MPVVQLPVNPPGASVRPDERALPPHEGKDTLHSWWSATGPAPQGRRFPARLIHPGRDHRGHDTSSPVTFRSVPALSAARFMSSWLAMMETWGPAYGVDRPAVARRSLGCPGGREAIGPVGLVVGGVLVSLFVVVFLQAEIGIGGSGVGDGVVVASGIGELAGVGHGEAVSLSVGISVGTGVAGVKGG